MYLNDREWVTLAWVAVMGVLSVMLNAAYQQFNIMILIEISI